MLDVMSRGPGTVLGLEVVGSLAVARWAGSSLVRMGIDCQSRFVMNGRSCLSGRQSKWSVSETQHKACGLLKVKLTTNLQFNC